MPITFDGRDRLQPFGISTMASLIQRIEGLLDVDLSAGRGRIGYVALADLCHPVLQLNDDVLEFRQKLLSHVSRRRGKWSSAG